MTELDPYRLFDQFDNEQENVQPDTGEGLVGWWPDAGTYRFAVLRIKTLEKARFYYSSDEADPKNPQRKKRVYVEAPGVQFIYRMVNDPGSPSGDPREVQDYPMVFLTEEQMKQIPENQQFLAEGEHARFKGHASIILGGELPGGVGEDLRAITKLIEEEREKGSLILVKADVRYRTYTDRQGVQRTSKDTIYLKERET